MHKVSWWRPLQSKMEFWFTWSYIGLIYATTVVLSSWIPWFCHVQKSLIYRAINIFNMVLFFINIFLPLLLQYSQNLNVVVEIHQLVQDTSWSVIFCIFFYQLWFSVKISICCKKEASLMRSREWLFSLMLFILRRPLCHLIVRNTGRLGYSQDQKDHIKTEVQAAVSWPPKTEGFKYQSSLEPSMREQQSGHLNFSLNGYFLSIASVNEKKKPIKLNLFELPNL